MLLRINSGHSAKDFAKPEAQRYRLTLPENTECFGYLREELANPTKYHTKKAAVNTAAFIKEPVYQIKSVCVTPGGFV